MAITTPQEAINKLEAALKHVTMADTYTTDKRKHFPAVTKDDIDVFNYIKSNIATLEATKPKTPEINKLSAAIENYCLSLEKKIKELSEEFTESGAIEVHTLQAHKRKIENDLKTIDGEAPENKYKRYIGILKHLITDGYIDIISKGLDIHPVKRKTKLVTGERLLAVKFDDPAPAENVMLRVEKIGAKLGAIKRFLETETASGSELDANKIIGALQTKIASLKDNTKVRPKTHDGKIDPTSAAVKAANIENRNRIYQDAGIIFVNATNTYTSQVAGKNIWQMTVSPHSLKFTVQPTAIHTGTATEDLTTEKKAALALWDGIDVSAKNLVGTGVGHQTAKVYITKDDGTPETDLANIEKNLELIAKTALNLLMINIIPQFDAATNKAIEEYLKKHELSTKQAAWELCEVQNIQKSYATNSSEDGLRAILTSVTNLVDADKHYTPELESLAQKRTTYTPPPTPHHH